jgi:inorganic triphosphatase YgiF
MDRIELTAPVRRDKRHRKGARSLPESEPLRRARKMVGHRADLRPALTLLTDRRKQIFGRGKERVELDIDRVTVRGAGGHTEIELENLSASPETFQEALAELRRRFGKGLVSSRLSKYDMGLRRLKRRG